MTSLTSYLSSDYQKALNSLAPKSASKTILVYVEGIEDVSFWHSILSRYEKQAQIRFEMQPYSNSSLTTGKMGLEKLFDNTGEYLIICLDSDYDFIFQDHSETSKQINKNPYIFQTYAYSIENLKCYAESLANICVQVSHNATEKVSFLGFLGRYSKIVYDLFIWNLYFYSIHDFSTFTISDFNSAIRITENPIVEEFGATTLENIKVRVNNKLQELHNQFPEHTAKIKPLAEQLSNLGLNNTNTYLFINGHTIYDNVVLMLLKTVCRALKKDHDQKIDISSAIPGEKINKKIQYKNLVGRLDDTVEMVLSKNDKFEDCFLFKKIEHDIEEYLKKHFVQVDIIPSA